jgi:hypothetical protein
MPREKKDTKELSPLAVFSKTIADATKSFHDNMQKLPGAPAATEKLSRLGNATKRVPLVKKVSSVLDKFTKKAPLLKNVRKGIEASGDEKKKTTRKVKQ